MAVAKSILLLSAAALNTQAIETRAGQSLRRTGGPDKAARIVLIDSARTEMVACTNSMAWNKSVGLVMEKEAKINEWLGKISKAYDEYRMDPNAYCDCEAMVGKYAMLNGLGMQAAREQSVGYLTYRFSDNLRKAYSACVEAKKPNQKCPEPEQALSGDMF